MSTQDQSTTPQTCRTCGQPLPVEQTPSWDDVDKIVKGSKR